MSEQRQVTDEYPYTDPDGNVLYVVKRYLPKGFAQFRPDGRPGLDGIERVPYNLPEVLKASEVWIVEGEKDVHTIRDHGNGYVATTFPGGAKWRPEYLKWFVGRKVNVLPDNDKTGGVAAQKIVEALRDAEVVTDVYTCAPFKDVTEMYESTGHMELILEEPCPPIEPYWVDLGGYDATEIDWLWKPVLPRRAFVLFYGPTQSTKSMFLQWAGGQLSLQGYKVSYYSLENPTVVDAKRMERLGYDPHNFRLSNKLINLASKKDEEDLIERNKGQDLIIIDTYSHAYPFNVDGDSNEAAVKFGQLVRRIIARTGATVAVVDHTGYQQPEEPRGASAKRQQVDIAILMRDQGEWRGKGHNAWFNMKNMKVARFSNPFYVTGYVEDLSDDRMNIVLKWPEAYGVE